MDVFVPMTRSNNMVELAAYNVEYSMWFDTWGMFVI